MTTHSPVPRRPARPRVPSPRRSARPRSPTWPGPAAAGRVAPGSRRRVQPPECCASAKEQRRRTLLPGPAPRPDSAPTAPPPTSPVLPLPELELGPRVHLTPLRCPGPAPPLALPTMTLLDSQVFAVPPSPAHIPGPTHPCLVPGGSPRPAISSVLVIPPPCHPRAPHYSLHGSPEGYAMALSMEKGRWVVRTRKIRQVTSMAPE